jgi:hypothetical protein
VPAAAVTRAVASQLRLAHEQTINQNGVSLVFLRQTRHRDRGGFSQWADDPVGGFGPFVCAVAWQNIGRPFEAGGDAGLMQKDQTWVLAAPVSTPFTANDNDENLVRIETNHPLYGRLRLHNIKPLAYGDVVWGWQASLEAIR